MPRADMLWDSYITLTPTAASSSYRGNTHSARTNDLLIRKRAAAAKRKALVETTKGQEPEDGTDRYSSRTETDRSSEIGNDETPDEDDTVSTKSGLESDAKEKKKTKKEKDEVVEEKEVNIPTYVCELHDPKPVLIGACALTVGRLVHLGNLFSNLC